jgi:hypothetical protein
MSFEELIEKHLKLLFLKQFLEQKSQPNRASGFGWP